MTSQKVELTTDTSSLLILGSGSIARKELLSSVGLVPDKVEKPNVDESRRQNESPSVYVRRVATLKADAVASQDDAYLITADTVVAVGQKLLMKTSDEVRAREYLRLLSGRRHSVFTAFCVKHNGEVRSRLVKTVLKMKFLTDKEIIAYINSRENVFFHLYLVVTQMLLVCPCQD